MEKATSAYSEHVGRNRQLDGARGDINTWYTRTKNISRLRIGYLILNSAHTSLYLIQYGFEFTFNCSVLQCTHPDMAFRNSHYIQIGI